MMRLLLSLLSLFSTIICIGQKAIIDSTAINYWKMFDDDQLAISGDGQFFSYRISNDPFSTNTLIIGSTNGEWKQEFVGATKVAFSEDCKLFVFQKEDTLGFLTLKTSNLKNVAGVTSYKQPKEKGEWLAYELKNNNKELILLNLISAKEVHHNTVANYTFDDNGKILVLQKATKQGNHLNVLLQLQLLKTGELINIYEGQDISISGVTIDKESKQIAFIVQQGSASHPNSELFYYRLGMKMAIAKVTNTMARMDSDLIVQYPLSFSKNGRYISFSLYKPEARKPKSDAVLVNIWSYMDKELQSRQLRQNRPIKYSAVISTSSNGDSIEKVVRLTGEDEIIWGSQRKGDFAIIRHDPKGDRFWMDTLTTYWLVSLKDGFRKPLKTQGFSTFSFSPDGKYLVYYDALPGRYFSYDLKTGYVSVISKGLSADQFVYNDGFTKGRLAGDIAFPVGIATWIKDDSGVLVYDNYDIWLLDPAGKKDPINITKGYGSSHKIKFRLVQQDIQEGVSGDQPLLVSAFNTKTKFNGFYKILINIKRDPELLVMGPYTFFHTLQQLPSNANHFTQEMEPLKASKANSWIVKRHSFNEAPNYFLTNDFITYKALTDLQPHINHNWLTAELITWNQLDGTSSQGVLYKPENFNPIKKYPVIISYYNQLSHRLFEFPFPYYTGSGNINIPWFVSRGYLVFTPDIHFTRGKDGLSALNTIVSAGKYLSKLPFVKGNKIGIAGHSHAGGLTNFIITHTNLFAAAFEGAGVSDIISSSLQLSWEGALSRLGAYEKMFGTNLWESPEKYLEASPIMLANKITTPLLMFHCKPDGAVPWEQAIELFIALRRLEKKVWLIEYDHGNHEVNGKEAADLTIRATQFFDHYLRDMPSPKWMTRGIPAKLKGIENGLELDLSDLKK